MKDALPNLRKILRRAESASEHPEERLELEQEGIFIGEEEEVDREALLAELEGEDAGSALSVTVTVASGNSAVSDRDNIEEPLSEFVEGSGIGVWVGSGQGSIGEQHFFDVTFEVEDPTQAASQIRSFLDSRFPGLEITIRSSDSMD